SILNFKLTSSHLASFRPQSRERNEGPLLNRLGAVPQSPYPLAFACSLVYVLGVTENAKSKKPRTDDSAEPIARVEDLGRPAKPVPEETRHWFKSLEYVVESILSQHGSEQARFFVDHLQERLRQAGIKVPTTTTTPYLNT